MKTTALPGWFQTIDAGLTRLMRGSGYLAAISLMICMAVAVVDVVMAKFFMSGIPYATEIIQYLNVAIVFFGVACVQLSMGHTSVDLLWDKFPRPVRFWIKTGCNIIAVGVCGFFGYRAILLMIERYNLHTLSSGGAVGFQIWPFVAILVWGFLSLAVASLWCVVRALVDPARYVLHEDSDSGKEETV